MYILHVERFDTMTLTPIKQVAEQLDKLSDNTIYVQTIEYYCKQLSIDFTYKNRLRYLTDNDIDKIKQRYVNSNEHTQHNTDEHTTTHTQHNTTHNTSDTSDNNDMYNKVLNELIKQLNAKDNQIDKLQQQLSDTTQALHNQQRLDYDRLHDSGSSENIQTTYTDNTQATHRAHTSTHEPTNNGSDVSDNSPASHTHSDVHTDDISDDNKNSVDNTDNNKEGVNTISNEHTDDNKNTTNTGTYTDDKGAEHKNKIGFFARIFGK
ncbi:hypothetical protein AABD35_13010 [Staphylococcus xylosus]|uniref:hypothetical protein n=1 Tax=Staphylococcus xylosus TaxID=1288 RepID=UPI00398B434A